MHENELKYDDFDQIPIALLSVRIDIVKIEYFEVNWNFEKFDCGNEKGYYIDIIVRGVDYSQQNHTNRRRIQCQFKHPDRFPNNIVNVREKFAINYILLYGFYENFRELEDNSDELK